MDHGTFLSAAMRELLSHLDETAFGERVIPSVKGGGSFSTGDLWRFCTKARDAA